jgi:hypothetical protein
LTETNYETALKLLEPTATYQRGGDLITGASAIVESFHKVSDWATNNLDAMEYSHEIDDDASPLEISFIDVLRCKGDELRIQHSVFLELSDNGLIRRLSFTQPPGEKEVLGAFFRRQQLTPPGR